MKFRLLAFLVLVSFLNNCSAPNTPQPNPTGTPAPVVPTSTASPQPTATVNGLGINIVGQFDPTTHILTIFGMTPEATIVYGAVALGPTATPTTAATSTTESSATPPPTNTRVPVVVAQQPTPAPPVSVSAASLRGKILFKSLRNGGYFPSKFNYYSMNADGSGVQALDFKPAEAIYTSLLPYEGFTPDRSQVVVGEVACNAAPCLLYILDPKVNPNFVRNQGQWTPSVSGRALKSVDPVWAPQGDWIAFVGNWENNHTNNIFKGTPFKRPATFLRLTDFGGQADTRHPSYSPDGSSLAFATQIEGHWQIWVLDPTAQDYRTANPHNISSSASDDWDPLWVK